MIETDISKVLIEGDTATIMGVKYKRVEEPKPQTLTDLIYQWWEDIFVGETSMAELVDRIEAWLPKEHDTNDYKWNACIKMIKDNLR